MAGQCDALCHQLLCQKKVEVNGCYVNTAQNKHSAADGALILSLVTPSCVVLRSFAVAVSGLQF